MNLYANPHLIASQMTQQKLDPNVRLQLLREYGANLGEFYNRFFFYICTTLV